MGGVLERIRWLQKRPAIALLPSPPVDPMILELQAAKEILAEVFRVRVSEVEEMILKRMMRFAMKKIAQRKWCCGQGSSS
jgi:hypothetical protein